MTAQARTIVRRELILSTCAALWGLGLAIALLGVWIQPAPVGQAPSLATQQGVDSHASMRLSLSLIILPFLFPLLLRPLTRRLAADDVQSWARNAAATAMVMGLWIAHRQLWQWAFYPTAAALLVIWFLRRFEARFTRHDLILIPTSLMVLIALIDLRRFTPLEEQTFLTLAIVFGVRLIVAYLRPPIPPAFAFAAAPLGLVWQTNFFGYDDRHFGWGPLGFAVLTPLLLTAVLKHWPRQLTRARMLRLLSFAIYPIALYAYVNATSLVTAEGMPRVDFFEDVHGILPAAEWLRGELPYRDAIPGHGFIEDGLLDYLGMLGNGSLEGAHRMRAILGHLNIVALYAVGAAATGVPEMGLLCALGAMSLGNAFAVFRNVPALFGVAVIAAAMRRRNAKYFGWAGALVVLASLTSLDFGAYTFLAMCLGMVRLRGQRMQAFKWAVIGVAASLIPTFIVFLILGFGIDFVTTTLFDVMTAAPAYAMLPYLVPAAFQKFPNFPEVLAALWDREGMLSIIGLAAAIFFGVVFARRPLSGSRRIDPVLIIAGWITFNAISYGERHHFHFQHLAFMFLLGLTWLLLRRHFQAGLVAAALLLILAIPTTNLVILAWMRSSNGPVDFRWRKVEGLPRAGKVLFNEKDLPVINGFKRYADARLQPDQTFIDFTNRSLLYVIFDRDNPVRQVEVAFYQPERLQREVIARIERNPKIVAALVPVSMADGTGVDGVSNQTRAPLVWKYITDNFTPEFHEGPVMVWRRKGT